MPSPDWEKEVAASSTGSRLTDADFHENFNEVLAELRERDPVHQDRQFDRVVLTRAADVEAVISDRCLYSDAAKARPGAYLYRTPGASVLNRPSFMFTDDPDHKRIRGLVAKAFNARSVEALRPKVEAFATELIDMVPSGEPFDVVRSFAAPLPTMVIATLLGVDRAHLDDFKRWSEALMLSSDRTPAQLAAMRAGAEQLQAYLAEAVASRRHHRMDDLISHLVAAEEDQQSLTRSEIVAACRLLLVAGNITTTDLIGNAVVALLDNPSQRLKWQARPDLTSAMVEEVLRYDSPVISISRTAPPGWSIGGCPVPAGQSITAMLAAANRDPALHADPNRFDIERTPQRHMSFGGGAHFCLGAPLARLEAEIGVSAIFRRFPKLRLAQGPRPSRRATASFNGFKEIWVTA